MERLEGKAAILARLASEGAKVMVADIAPAEETEAIASICTDVTSASDVGRGGWRRHGPYRSAQCAACQRLRTQRTAS